MKSITIPHTTFVLYKNGARTFIHIPKESEALNGAQFGDEISIIDDETNENMTQVFWFLYDFTEIERFKFIVFKWEKTDNLFFNRKNYARTKSKQKPSCERLHIEELSKYQKFLYNGLAALSSLFYISKEEHELFAGNMFLFCKEKDTPMKTNESYMIVNKLGIYKNDSKTELFYIYSLFPLSFLNL